MTVNRVFLNAINGGNTDISELKGEYEKKMKQHAQEQQERQSQFE